MNKRNQILVGTALAAAGLVSQAAKADTIPFSENFNNFTAVTYGGGGVTSFTSQASWSVQTVSSPGTANVDLYYTGVGPSGVTCHGSASPNGCIDLDGSNEDGNGTGPLIQSGSFSLLAGHTYQLSAWISGNQRGGTADNVALAFLNSPVSTPAIVATGSTQTFTGLLASNAPFAQYFVTYTPTANITASIGFYNISNNSYISDSLGAILDDVAVADITAVPLPASAWLLLTGLLGLGLFSRRNGGQSLLRI